mmetsp:Transcript_21503/g.46881  ORF Transcript_21503/g.46881 Transcript_21503/m.46881 type:complete len:278 (+) Transcript_21503:105-938(+)
MSRRPKAVNVGLAGALLATVAVNASAFTALHPTCTQAVITSTTCRNTCTSDMMRASPLYAANGDDDTTIANHGRVAGIGNIIATAALASAVAFSPLGDAKAYDPSDYASETVTAAVSTLKKAEGDAGKSFQAFEEIAAIIAEGKGIGGSVNYNGVQLERGYIADEDTTIYNPGLTLLTESEKDRLVEALVKNRKAGISTSAWSNDNELGFSELKSKLDPLFMYELRGYLKILPFYGAAVYLATFFVQQNLRDLFPVAYIVGVVAVFGPIAGLIAAGP